MFIGNWSLGLVFKDEYFEHNDQWINDGKPLNVFWKPPKTNLIFQLSSFWAFGKYQIIWLFTTPSWIYNNKKAYFKLWIYRIATPLGFLIVIVAFMLAAKIMR